MEYQREPFNSHHFLKNSYHLLHRLSPKENPQLVPGPQSTENKNEELYYYATWSVLKTVDGRFSKSSKYIFEQYYALFKFIKTDLRAYQNESEFISPFNSLCQNTLQYRIYNPFFSNVKNISKIRSNIH